MHFWERAVRGAVHVYRPYRAFFGEGGKRSCTVYRPFLGEDGKGAVNVYRPYRAYSGEGGKGGGKRVPSVPCIFRRER